MIAIVRELPLAPSSCLFAMLCAICYTLCVINMLHVICYRLHVTCYMGSVWCYVLCVVLYVICDMLYIYVIIRSMLYVCVICYMLYVTGYMLYVACYMVSVICWLLSVICYMLYVTCYITCYMVCVCYMLYVICYMLYVICYMVYVIYMLYVICYMLYVICYMLYVICYMLSVKCCVLCAMCYKLHVTCYVRLLHFVLCVVVETLWHGTVFLFYMDIWIFGYIYIYIIYILLYIILLYTHYIHIIYTLYGHTWTRIPALCGCVATACGTSAVPGKWCPWIFEYVYYQISWCSLIWDPLTFVFKKWAIWSNDYASKARIEILCKQMCCSAPNHFSKSHLLGNFWKCRTLARMSTFCVIFYISYIWYVAVSLGSRATCLPKQAQDLEILTKVDQIANLR